MTKRTAFIAFDTIRTSDAAYTWASKDWNGTVRFHTSETAARRINGQHVRTREATREDRAAVRAAKTAAEAHRARRAAAFDAAWMACNGTSEQKRDAARAAAEAI